MREPGSPDPHSPFPQIKMKWSIWRFIVTPWFYFCSWTYHWELFQSVLCCLICFWWCFDQSWLVYAGNLVTKQGLFSFWLQQRRYGPTPSASSLDISKLPPRSRWPASTWQMQPQQPLSLWPDGRGMQHLCAGNLLTNDPFQIRAIRCWGRLQLPGKEERE